MLKKEELVQEILEMEWGLFTNLNNTGGRASCQDNKDEFYITRSSQWESLSIEVLNSYLNDLYNAQENGRNMLFEKYAYMMEFTHPEEYNEIKKYLPREDIMKNKVISMIEKKVMKWEEEFFNKYPKLSKKVRNLEEIKKDDIAPIKVYLIGEHKSYSYTTNIYYYDYISNLEYNLVEEIFKKIIIKKGFESLNEAENSIV